jgi:hypothetical protein
LGRSSRLARHFAKTHTESYEIKDKQMRSLLAALTFLASVTFAIAQTAKPVTFEELCKYEKLCQQLKDSGGFIKPKKKILLLLNELREPIKSISEKLGVDPRAVAGAIAAENTMNVQVDDDIQDWLVKLQIAPTASILGKSFTIGLGQIHVEAAAQVEPMLAKLEKRTTRSSKEIADALLTPVGAIAYAAGIVRKAQDDYKAQGIDVSDRPEILTTLYNLGNTDSKARTANASKQTPRPNYFGFFVQQNLDQIANAIEWKKKKVVAVEAAASAPSIAASSPSAATRDSSTEVVGSPTAAVSNFELRTVLNKSVQLSSFAPQCSTSGPGVTSEYAKVLTMQKSPSSTSARGEYQVVSRGLDCEMSPWILIRTKEGKTGWLDEKILKARTEKKNIEASTTCDPNEDTTCRENISKVVGRGVIGTTSGKLIEVKLVGAKENPEKVNLKRFHTEICFNKNKSGMYMGNTNPTKELSLTGEEAEALAKELDDRKAEIVKGLGLDKWDSPKNLYRSDIDGVISSLRVQCKAGCKGPVENVKILLASDFSQFRGLSGFKKYKATTKGGSFYFSPGQASTTKDLSVKEQWDAYFASIDSSCEDVFKIAKRSQRALKEAKASYQETLKTSPNFTNTPNGDIPKTCNSLGKILKRRAAKKAAEGADPNVQMEAKTDAECSDCQIQMTINWGNSSMSSYYSLEMMDNVLEKDDDFDELIYDSIDSLKRYFPSSQSSATEMMTCEYDPFESAKRVEALLKLPCVESAFVPDMFIVKKLDTYKGRIFHMPFVDDDRFAVRLKGNCQGVSK